MTPSRWRRLLTAVLALTTVIAGFAVGAPTAAAAASPNELYFNGKQIFLNGINVPWGGTDNYGKDLGCAYNASRFETMFDNLQQYGVNSVRFWIHIDGRCSPTFDANNYASGVPADFYANLDDFLARARAHNVAVLLTLWAPEMTTTSPDYLAVRPARTSFINDAGRTQSYLDNVLVPMARRYNDNPALLGYEVINEPEFAIASDDVWGAGNGNVGPGGRDLIQLATMQRFVAQQVVALHRNTSKYVVGAGSAAYKWSATQGDVTVGNWWSDANLKARVSDADKPYAYSDFYEVHWYDWEKGNGYSFSPWDGRGPGFYNTDGKPVVIGELPAKDDAYFSRDTKIKDSYDLGYAGFMFWSYYGIDGFGGWDDIKYKLKAFRDAHASEVDLNLGGSDVPLPSPGNGGGNTHSGSWAAKLNAGGTWRNLTQQPSVSVNTQYTALVEIRGTGKVDLRVHAGLWGTELGGTTCTATDAWTSCQVVFNTGSNNQVTFRLTDSNAGGIIYLDDATLESGHGNALSNTSFEDGSVNWTAEAPFSIVQNP